MINFKRVATASANILMATPLNEINLADSLASAMRAAYCEALLDFAHLNQDGARVIGPKAELVDEVIKRVMGEIG